MTVTDRVLNGLWQAIACPTFALSIGGAALAQAGVPASGSDASTFLRHLRPAIRVLGERDTSFDLAERMRYYHVPGVSLAVVDEFKIVLAAGYGVTQFGVAAPV